MQYSKHDGLAIKKFQYFGRFLSQSLCWTFLSLLSSVINILIIIIIIFIIAIIVIIIFIFNYYHLFQNHQKIL